MLPLICLGELAAVESGLKIPSSLKEALVCPEHQNLTCLEVATQKAAASPEPSPFAVSSERNLPFAEHNRPKKMRTLARNGLKRR